MCKWILSLCAVLLVAVGCATNEAAQPAVPEAAFLQRQLAALDSLARPEGVSPRDWDGLKFALRAAISARFEDADGGKAASAAPTSEGAKTKLKYVSPDGLFEWRYYNPGDYDQNGEVNISDLTPLAVHINSSVPLGPAGELSVQAVVDGDGNGQVTIADITPLGANLGRRVTEFKLYAATAFADYPPENGAHSTASPLAAIPLAQAKGDRTSERIYFQYDQGPLDSGMLYWLRPGDNTNGSEGTPSNIQELNLSKPTAALSATPFHGAAPLPVLFDGSASESFDPVTYSWDPEGDGTFVATGIDPTISHEYTAPGLYAATLRVELPVNGTIATATVFVNVGEVAAPKWYRYALPEEANQTSVTPYSVALGQQEGMPYVITIYDDGGLTKVNFQLATSTTGSTWDSEVEVFNTSGLYRHAFTYDVGGIPVMTYEHGGNLMYNRANGALPAAWFNMHMAAGLGPPVDWYSSRMVGAFPAMAYYHSTSAEVRYIESNNWIGDSWDPPLTVEAVTGSCTALTDIGGLPAVAFSDHAGFGAIMYCDSALIVNSLIFSAPVTVANGPTTFFDSLLTLSDGSPALVYHNLSVARVMFRRAPDAGGATWDDFVKLADTSGSQQLIPRALLVAGIPHAFWFDPAAGSLIHCNATDANGLTWTEPQTVASGVDGMINCSPVELHGVPAVAYVSEAGKFRFAIKY